MRALMSFDRATFDAADRFDAGYWREIVAYWMIVDGAKAGCTGFEPNVDFTEDLRPDRSNTAKNGSLYLATLAIHPRFRRNGFGRLLMEWQTCYARHNGFRRLVANVRSRNAPILALTRKFGFKPIRKSAGYYFGPADSTTVIELRLD